MFACGRAQCNGTPSFTYSAVSQTVSLHSCCNSSTARYNLQFYCILCAVCFHKLARVCSCTAIFPTCISAASDSAELHCVLHVLCLLQFATVCSDTVLYLQCVFAACYCCCGEPSARPGGPVAGSLDSHRASLAAAARLSPVSLSVDAARRPSAFIAHLAHKRPDTYMTDLGASTPSDKSRPAGGHCDVSRWSALKFENLLFFFNFYGKQKSTRAEISLIKISVFRLTLQLGSRVFNLSGKSGREKLICTFREAAADSAAASSPVLPSVAAAHLPAIRCAALPSAISRQEVALHNRTKHQRHAVPLLLLLFLFLFFLFSSSTSPYFLI